MRGLEGRLYCGMAGHLIRSIGLGLRGSPLYWQSSTAQAWWVISAGSGSLSPGGVLGCPLPGRGAAGAALLSEGADAGPLLAGDATLPALKAGDLATSGKALQGSWASFVPAGCQQPPFVPRDGITLLRSDDCAGRAHLQRRVCPGAQPAEGLAQRARWTGAKQP